MAPVSDRSFCRYWEITSRCSKADCMFVVADFSWEERLKPILNPKRIPLQTYRTNARSGCAARASDHLSACNGVDIVLSL